MAKVSPHCFRYVYLLVHLVNVIVLIFALLVSHQMVNYWQKTAKFGNSSEKLSRVFPLLFHVFRFVASRQSFLVL